MAEVQCSAGANAVPDVDSQRKEIHGYFTGKQQEGDIL